MLWQRLFAALLGTALVGYGAMTLGTEVSVSSNKAEAAGEVIDVQPASRAPDTITVEFLVAGKEVRADIEDDGYSVGDEVRVQYDREHPTRARIKGSYGQVLAGVIFGGLGVVLVYAVYNPRWAFRRRR
jgi:hypothetical protein